MNEIVPFLYVSVDSTVGRGLAPAVSRLKFMFLAGHKASPYIQYAMFCVIHGAMHILRQYPYFWF